MSGLRLGVGYDFILSSLGRYRVNLGTVNVDYLLNVTSLMDRNPARRFHIIGAVGGGVGFSDGRGSSPGAMGNVGVQFRYNLPANFDVHIEPCVSLYMNRIMPDYASGTHFVTMGRVFFGASYRF